MPRYLVTFKEVRYLSYTVEADDEDDADAKAEELYGFHEDQWTDLDTETIGSTVIPWPEDGPFPGIIERRSLY
jgi:hypothetical protein